MATTDPVLDETLDALDMPDEGLRRWFSNLEAFCARHGGERVYGELLGLVRECGARVEERAER